jgi:hypothetical protein
MPFYNCYKKAGFWNTKEMAAMRTLLPFVLSIGGKFYCEIAPVRILR